MPAIMRKWDEHSLQFPQKPYLYKRYIDDGIGIGQNERKKFIGIYKSCKCNTSQDKGCPQNKDR